MNQDQQLTNLEKLAEEMLRLHTQYTMQPNIGRMNAARTAKDSFFAELRAALTATQQAAPYGYCPICGAKGEMRERRMDGNDTCANGHNYKSSKAVQQAAPSQGAGENPAILRAHLDAMSAMSDFVMTPSVAAETTLRKAEGKFRSALLEASAQREQTAKDWFVLVPLRMTRAMQRVVEQDEWEWADVLVAANAVTEDEYEIALNGEQPAASKPEPQAQAGEPTEIWSFGHCRQNGNGVFLVTVLGQHAPSAQDRFITLQSHREAMSKVERGYDLACGVIRDLRESIAKKDAALKACVGALERCRKLNGHNPPLIIVVDDAITQGQEALK